MGCRQAFAVVMTPDLNDVILETFQKAASPLNFLGKASDGKNEVNEAKLTSIRGCPQNPRSPRRHTYIKLDSRN